MGSISEVSPLIEQNIKRRVGISSKELTALSSAELDALILLLKAGPPMGKYRVGGFYGGEGHISTTLLTEDRLLVGPILIDRYIKVEEIGIDVTTAASEGNLYTALYRDRGDGYPGAIIHKSAALAITTGFKSTASLDIELTPGLYWGGVVCNQVTTTVATVRSLICNSRFIGETAGANDVDMASYAEDTVTGAPNDAFSSTAIVAATAPRLLMKVKQA
jgi:hypothetical protein